MISIFTSVFNRANLIERLYHSLVNQTINDFEWIVIDDGSTDNIKFVVDRFINENKIRINYVRLKHGGKHRAINQVESIAQGEAIVFVDSDDTLLKNAVEGFVLLFNKIKDKNNIIAAATMMIDSKGMISGKCKKIENSIDITWIDRYDYGLDGEYCYIFKRGVWSEYKLPEYDGEYFASEAIAMLNMSKDNKLISFFDLVLYQYEYQIDGLSRNIETLYKNNPRGYAHLCFAWTDKQKDYKGYIDACRNFYEICIDKVDDAEIDKTLHINRVEKELIVLKIKATLELIVKKLNGTIGLYGYGYYGHKISRYMDMLDLKYVLIDKNVDITGTDKRISSIENLKKSLDIVVVCTQDKKAKEEIKENINKYMIHAKVIDYEEVYVD